MSNLTVTDSIYGADGPVGSPNSTISLLMAATIFSVGVDQAISLPVARAVRKAGFGHEPEPCLHEFLSHIAMSPEA